MRRITFLIFCLLATTLSINGYSQCPNQVPNGNFEQGPVLFSTGYVLNSSGIIDAGEFEVSIVPNHPCFQGPDHTPAGPGNAMHVNASSTPNLLVWERVIPVIPGRTYDFSAWVLGQCSNISPAVLNFSINGVQVGSDFSPTVPYQWQMFSATWNSGASTTATLRIVDENLSLNGNDFSLDDISLVRMSAPEVCNGIDDDCNGIVDDGFVNTDGDFLADCVDPDDDNDGIPDTTDNCPLLSSAATCVQAYTGVSPVGNQEYTERLGMVFTVNTPIVITQLGAYDDNGDGLTRNIVVGIVNSSGMTLAGVSFFGNTLPLVGGHRMRLIPSLVLGPGTYTVVAVGYGPGERNGNNNLGSGYPNTVFNSNGGAITSVSSSYGGVGFGAPTTPHPDPNEFHAGTFCFSKLASQFPNFDNDSMGDPCDPDDDNDGVPDVYDCEPYNKKKDKWLVCHNGNTICIAQPAVQAHLNHGDQLGACPSNRGDQPVTYVSDYKLNAAPNPLSSSTTIQYELPVESKVSITLYDPLGRVVAVLVDGNKNPGVHNYLLDASKLSAGMYYYKMIAISEDEKFVDGQKLIIVK